MAQRVPPDFGLLHPSQTFLFPLRSWRTEPTLGFNPDNKIPSRKILAVRIPSGDKGRFPCLFSCPRVVDGWLVRR